MICRRKSFCLLLSPGAIKTYSCIKIYLGPVQGGELSQSVQHSLKIQPHPSLDKEALDSNTIFIQMYILPPALPSWGWKEGPCCFMVPWLRWQASWRSSFGFLCCIFLHQELATSLQIMVVPEKKILSGHSQLVLGQGRSSYWTCAVMYLACPGLVVFFISDKLLWVSLNVSSR